MNTVGVLARADLNDAGPMLRELVSWLRGHGVPTQTGKFGAHMEVEIHNDGPVTIWLEK